MFDFHHSLRQALLPAVLVCAPAFAAPPSQLSILRACGESDTAAQCERVVEAEQIRQFSSVASRDGGVLRLKTQSGRTIELRDQGVPGAGVMPVIPGQFTELIIDQWN